ncbi:unnamed protein product [Acanthoscelides obtectus]|uniref:Uncharacterized protein n=1 Tax=Acanthoscelides obtectus TaxID=200917 RepID=A0A9P0PPQ8_ACAOB|nr:unnamed protein product [Acanthoscelides obtectus]CAK1638676.1 hypothetical protein AOBTE_LOCUS10751 [Acanthoscelides obtectus]
MRSRKFIFLKICTFMIAISVCSSDSNNMRLKDVLRDSAGYGNNNDNRTDGNNNDFDENDFKGATNRMMSRCSSNSNSDNNNNRNNGDSNNYNRGRNYGYENDRNNEYGDSNNRYNNGNGYNGNNGNSDGQNDDRYYNNGYNNYGGSYSDNRDRNKNCDMPYDRGGNDRSSSGYGYSEYGRGYSNSNNQGTNNYDSRNRDSNRDSNSRSGGYEDGYGRSMMSYQTSNYNRRPDSGYFAVRGSNSKIRLKRYNKRDNDNQCVSQCIFGYMELLDDDQVPSETAVIKWVQDHIADDDLKRIKTLREIRKCFGRLSTNDIQDGCEYSKELSRCLNLELE